MLKINRCRVVVSSYVNVLIELDTLLSFTICYHLENYYLFMIWMHMCDVLRFVKKKKFVSSRFFIFFFIWLNFESSLSNSDWDRERMGVLSRVFVENNEISTNKWDRNSRNKGKGKKMNKNVSTHTHTYSSRMHTDVISVEFWKPLREIIIWMTVNHRLKLMEPACNKKSNSQSKCFNHCWSLCRTFKWPHIDSVID